MTFEVTDNRNAVDKKADQVHPKRAYDSKNITVNLTDLISGKIDIRGFSLMTVKWPAFTTSTTGKIEFGDDENGYIEDADITMDLTAAGYLRTSNFAEAPFIKFKVDIAETVSEKQVVIYLS